MFNFLDTATRKYPLEKLLLSRKRMHVRQIDRTGRSEPNVREQIPCFNFLMPQKLCQGRRRRGWKMRERHEREVEKVRLCIAESIFQPAKQEQQKCRNPNPSFLGSRTYLERRETGAVQDRHRSTPTPNRRRGCLFHLLGGKIRATLKRIAKRQRNSCQEVGSAVPLLLAFLNLTVSASHVGAEKA